MSDQETQNQESQAAFDARHTAMAQQETQDREFLDSQRLDFRDIFRSIGTFLEGLLLNIKGDPRRHAFNAAWFGGEVREKPEALKESWEKTEAPDIVFRAQEGRYFNNETGEFLTEEEAQDALNTSVAFNEAAPDSTVAKDGLSLTFENAVAAVDQPEQPEVIGTIGFGPSLSRSA